MRHALPLAFALIAAPALAEDVEVDLELILAVDVSRSMSPMELEIQRRGYVAALTSEDVIGAIEGGMLGRIALTHVEWAGTGTQRVLVDWTLIDGRASAEAFAARLDASPGSTMRRTSIADAIDFASLWFEGNGFVAWRQVIDVSGDGPNNQGRPVTAARDDAVAAGIVINGLPLMTRDGAGGIWQLDDLDAYYESCVIGGPGAFMIAVDDWAQFATAVRRKLVLEIAGVPDTTVVPAQMPATGGYDCLIGERIWERNRRDWDIP